MKNLLEKNDSSTIRRYVEDFLKTTQADGAQDHNNHHAEEHHHHLPCIGVDNCFYSALGETILLFHLIK